MKVLMISNDRNILSIGSAVGERMKEYGKLVSELHIVLLSDKAHGFSDTALSPNVFVYPTNSSNKYSRPKDAAKLGLRLVPEKKFVRGQALITTQDPFECGWAGLKIKKHWRLPLEVQLHTDPFSQSFTGLLNFLRKRIARKVLRNADSVRVVTQSLAHEMAQKFNISEKIFVLPIYVDKQRLSNAVISFDLHTRFGWKEIILCVARLTKEKNITLALQAFAKVLPQSKGAGLVVVGDGPERAQLEDLAKRLKIFENVAFVGWQEQMASYYQTSTIFLQTSDFEGYGLALVEAGLAGLPAVSTPVGLAKELEAQKDLLVAEPSPEALSRAVLDLLAMPEQAKAMAEHFKGTLNGKLLSKEEYLKRLQENWLNTASKI
jgi:glycosyltransferase involved in cell wall biosynthesis